MTPLTLLAAVLGAVASVLPTLPPHSAGALERPPRSVAVLESPPHFALARFRVGLGLPLVAVASPFEPAGPPPAVETAEQGGPDAGWFEEWQYQAQETAAGTATESAVETAPSPEEILCSVDAVEEELSVVLNQLSKQTGANLILLSEPNQRLTLRLSNLPLTKMIRHICTISGLSYLTVDSTFVIASEDRLKAAYPEEWFAVNPEPEPEPEPEPAPPTVTEAYKVNHASASQLAEALKTLFGEEKITVVIGPGSSVPSLSDQQTSYATGIQVGTLSTSESEGTRTGRIIMIRGPADEVAAAIEVAKTLDQPRAQVSIAVMIHDVSNDALEELGLTWSYSDVNITETDPRGINFGSFTRAPLSFTAKIKALERTEKAKLLASPNISVLEGERAFILIGSRLNFPVLIGYTQANTPIFDRQEERVGIYLQVAAHVDGDNEITLSLYPQVSVVTGFLDINGASYPQISTREAQTTLRVKSGEVIVMGGMLKDEEVTIIEKVPFLAEIPILGALFRHRRKTKVSSQVIITILPVIITPRQDESG
ncbi:MAG: type II secretion system protein GspD [Armatimonadetes bacterium]|nr:type II secretion system protein GspD [Armatimonadota bacterium]